MSGAVLVAGGCGALGRAVVQTLAERGYAVAVVDQMRATAPGASVVEAVDLTDAEAVDAHYSELARTHGPYVGLVNVVGGFVWELVDGGSAASFERMFRINLLSVANSCRAALPHLVDGASIVNVGAQAADQPVAGMAPYAASKAGVRAFSESLARELAGRRIRVNLVCPTILDTAANREAMPDADRSRWIAPGAAAQAIALLLDDSAASVTGGSFPLAL